MARLVIFGAVAALFFSSTFVINRMLAVGGGHWFWTATLRYAYTFVILTVIVTFRSRKHGGIYELARFFGGRLRFWVLAGGVGFAGFYSLLCFGAEFTPGWIVATSWQLTVIMTPIVLSFLGMRLATPSVVLVLLVFLGVTLVNWKGLVALDESSYIGIAVIAVAAFCYPLGNTLLWLAEKGDHPLIEKISHWSISDAFARVWLMTAGALPVLVVLGIAVQPGYPSKQQLVWVACISVSTGVIATVLFLAARHRAKTPTELAAVDATQSLEVPFALALEVLMLTGSFPSALQLSGVAVVVGSVGLLAFSSARSQKVGAG